jgi:hypothetical protein
MAEGTVSVELTIEEQKALKAIASLQSKFQEFGDKAEKSFKKSDLALASFAGNLASTVVTKGLGLLVDGFQSLVGSIEDAAKMAAESQQAVTNLGVALAQTGQFTKEGLKAFEDYADAVEKTTGISGEAVLETATFIQQVNKLSQRELKQATQATIDFAAALNLDLGTATSIVAKGIDGNTAGLKKYGVEVAKGATESERLANVLNALSGVSGAAEAKTKTFAGGFELFKVSIEDFRKAIGFLIIENPAVIAALQGISKGVQFLTGIISANKGAITDFITNGVLKLVESFSFAADIVVFFNKAFAGFDIVGKLFQQALFSIDSGLREFSITTQEVGIALKNLYGGDTSGEQKIIASQKQMIALNQENKAAIDSEITSILNKTTAQNKAATETANVVINTTKAALEAQKAAQAEGNTAFLEGINQRAADAAAGEKKVIDAVLLVRETAKANEEAKGQEALLMEQLKAEEGFIFLQERLGKEEALREVARAQELSRTGGHDAAILSLRAARTKAEQAGIFQVQKYEEISQKQRLDNLKGTLGTIATLQSSGSKELFMVGKAAALGTATIDGIQAVQKALASAPPPFNYALAAAVGVASAANIAKIASQQPPKFAKGGIVGGNSMSGDKISAQVNSGEMILTRQQQSKLFSDINNGGGGGSVIAAISALGDRIAGMTIVVQANSREIARLVRDEREAGFAV